MHLELGASISKDKYEIFMPTWTRNPESATDEITYPTDLSAGEESGLFSQTIYKIRMNLDLFFIFWIFYIASTGTGKSKYNRLYS